MFVPSICCVSQIYMLLIGKGDSQMSTLMERLRARSLHQASWMETVKVLNTSLSAVSNAVSVSCFYLENVEISADLKLLRARSWEMCSCLLLCRM